MAFIVVGTDADLKIEIPTKRTTGWADELKLKFFDRVSVHDHTGSGKGRQLGAASILADAIGATKILLENNEYLRAVGGNLLKLNPTGALEIAPTTTVFNSNNVRLEADPEGNELKIDNVLGTTTLRVVGDILTEDGDIIAANKAIAPVSQLVPQSADPLSPTEGDQFYSDGTSRAKGVYIYQDGAWVAPGVPDSSITDAKLAPSAVTEAKVADNAITNAKLADNAVNTNELINLAVTSGKLANQAVETGKIADLAVTTPKIAAAQITPDKMASQIASGLFKWNYAESLPASTYINLSQYFALHKFIILTATTNQTNSILEMGPQTETVRVINKSGATRSFTIQADEFVASTTMSVTNNSMVTYVFYRIGGTGVLLQTNAQTV